jgi:preprotein translocase subunit YajC/RNA polymerase subunit RPABC4/transcription elongation factor Spt4
MWKFFSKTKSIKEDLLSFKNEPLTPLSIILLIILDLFIYANVMVGVDGETDKSPKPYAYFPSSCTKHFDSPRSSYTDFGTIRHASGIHARQISPYCTELQSKIDLFAKTPVFDQRRHKILDLDNRIRQNNRRLDAIRGQYNTRLFEHIAKMSNNKALNSAKAEYDALHADNAKLDRMKMALPLVMTLEGYGAYRSYVTSKKQEFLEHKASYEFWQPFYEYGHMLTFVLPLLLIFGIVYYRTKRRELRGESYNPVIKIIAAHISVILALPLVWYTLTLVYHVMPKTLLKQIVEFLIGLGLLSILNYLLIAVIVLVFGLLIYFVQKRTLRHKRAGRENSVKQFIALSKCHQCGYRVDYTRPYCPHCGTKLLRSCEHCSKMTIDKLPFCQECGKGSET